MVCQVNRNLENKMYNCELKLIGKEDVWTSYEMNVSLQIISHS